MDTENTQNPAGREPVTGQILPPAEEEAIRELVKIEVSRSISYSGPLPQASEFQLYEATLAGAADRILTMAEREQEERLKTQREYIQAGIKWKSRGQLFAGILALMFCALACWLINKEQYIPATAVLGMIASLVYVFISGRRGKTELQQTEKQENE